MHVCAVGFSKGIKGPRVSISVTTSICVESIFCVTAIVLVQLWLVLVLRAWGEVKGLGGFLLLVAALADTPSYIPIIIPCMSGPKILTDQDLQQQSSFFFFSNQR